MTIKLNRQLGGNKPGTNLDLSTEAEAYLVGQGVAEAISSKTSAERDEDQEQKPKRNTRKTAAKTSK